MAERSGGGPEVRPQRRFDILMRLNKEFVFKNSEVLGIENLDEIPPGPLVIATPHLSDADVQTKVI